MQTESFATRALSSAQEGRVLEIASGTLKEKAHGLARPTGIALAGDGACFVAESDKGRVVQIDGGGTATAVIEGLKEPQGLAIGGDDSFRDSVKSPAQIMA